VTAEEAVGAAAAKHAARLAARYTAAALVSGRPADYLAQHAGAPGVRYLGLYGLQEIHDGQVRADPRLEAARPARIERDLRR
jgi:hypothetical protein